MYRRCIPGAPIDASRKAVHGEGMGITNNSPTFDVVRDASGGLGRVRLSGEIDIYASADLERAFESLSGREIVIVLRRCITHRSWSGYRLGEIVPRANLPEGITTAAGRRQPGRTPVAPACGGLVGPGEMC